MSKSRSFLPKNRKEFERGFLKLTKRMLVSYLIAFIVLSGTGLVFLFNPWSVKETEAAWFNDNWGYRHLVTFTHNADISADRAVTFTLDTAELIAANLMQANCDDTRFTDPSGNLLLFDLTGTCNNASTTYEVILPKISNGTNLFYVYYGNPAAVNTEVDSTTYTALTPSGGDPSLTNPTSSGNQEKGTTPVAYWKFDEGSGSASYSVLPSAGGVTYIQSKSNQSNASSSQFQSTVTASFDNLPQAGNLVVAAAACWNVNPSTTGVTDNTGITYTHILTRQAGANQVYVALYYTVLASTPTSTYTVTFNCDGGGGNDDMAIAIHEYTGTDPSPLDQSTSATGNSTTPSSGNITTTQNGELYFGALAETSDTSMGPGTGYTQREELEDNSDTQGILTEDKTGNAQTTSAGFSLSGANDWAATIASFKAKFPNNPVAALASGTARQTEDLCMAGKCLKFDGSDDHARVNDLTNLDFAATDSFSIGTWVKRNGASSAINYIASKADTTNGGYKMWMDADGDLCFGIDDDGTWGPDISTCSSNANFDDDKWHYVVGVRDTTSDTVKVYVDGTQKDSQTDPTTATLANTNNLFIGADRDGTSNEWLGFIDEFKVYKQALSASQVAANYNSNSNPEGTSIVLGTNTQNMPGALSNGLVGYWKMDESSWTSDCATEQVLDSSGNSNNGEACPNGGAPSPTVGKYGNAGSFNGTTQYISIDDSATLRPGNGDFSVSVWANPANANQTSPLITKRLDGFPFEQWSLWICGSASCGSSGQQFTALLTEVTSTTERRASTTTDVADGNWHLYTAVFDNESDSIKLYVDGALMTATAENAGSWPTVDNTDPVRFANSNGTNYYSGKVDEARIYNRALSDTEVSQLYNWAPGPVGYWKMDEGSWIGTSGEVKDSSGNGLNGTATNGPTTITGKYGKAGDFDGSNDLIQIADNALLTPPNDMSISLWVKLDQTASSRAENIMLLRPDNSVSPWHAFQFYIQPSDDKLVMQWINTGGTTYNVSSSTALATNTWYHIKYVKNGSLAKIYLNGINDTFGTGDTHVGTMFDSSGNLTIGAAGSASQRLDGKIDDVKIYNYARSQAQVIEDMNAGHPAPGSPVGSPILNLKLDEGYGTTANNSGSATSISGTITGSPAWTNSGKFGKALSFDGTTNQYVAIPGTGSMEAITDGSHSFSAWAKADALPANTDASNTAGAVLARPGFHMGLFLSPNVGSGFYFTAYNTSDTGFSAVQSKAVTLGNWYHLVGVLNTTDNTVKMYVNGILTGTTTFTGTPRDYGTNSYYVGKAGTGICTTSSIACFDGTVDEPRIYNQALTAEQVKLEYNRASGQVMGALSDTNAANTSQPNSAASEYCVPGDTVTSCAAPVGRWDFEQKNTTTVYDVSGNGKNGTWSATGAFTSGIKGAAGSFNGSRSVSLGNSSGLGSMTSATIMAWVKNTGTSGTDDRVISIANATNSVNTALGMAVLKSTVYATGSGRNGANAQLDVNGSTTPINDGKWHHVAFTVSGSTGTLYVDGKFEASSTSLDNTNTFNWASGGQPARIGATTDGATQNFTGGIDEVRLYNYALTPAQIAWTYNRGAPIAYWKMDECQGTTINDSSGNSLTGTLTNAASPGMCATSGSWFNGATGKRNYSMDFDGSDDHISVSDNNAISIDSGLAQGFTYATWAYPNSDGETDVGEIFDKGTNTFCRTNSESGSRVTITCRVDLTTDADFSATTTIPINTWSHLAFSWTNDADDEVTIWINGIPQTSSAAFAGDGAADANALTIGGTPNFDGQLDDFRIYNYELTTSQIKALINEGATRFGPTTGAP